MPGCQTNSLLALLLSALALTACHAEEHKPPHEISTGVQQLGRLSDLRLSESSGVVASRRHPGVLWTHNDGGGLRRQFLYAVNRQGDLLASFPVTGATIEDWEDIAIDDAGHLFISDTGNNDAKREELAVYQIDEPDPKSGAKTLSVKHQWKLRFPAGRFDCESLFIWQDHGYVISKVFDDARAQIFRFPMKDAAKPLILELVATTKIQSPVTGADISSDGKLLGIVAKNGAHVFRIDGDVSKVIKGKPHLTKFKDEHIEGCCFVPEGLLATSEGREIFLFTDPAFRVK